VSSTLGAAAAGTGPVTGLVGDVAAIHDLNALATAARLALPLTIVVIHNDGGGIFHLLPQSNPSELDPAIFERHFATPHGIDFVAVARALEMDAERIDSRADLERALTDRPVGPRLIEIRTDRAANAEHHRRLRAMVAAALG